VKVAIYAHGASHSVILLSLVGTAFGQSRFEVANTHFPIVDAPIFDERGIPLASSNYVAELYGGAVPDLLKPLVSFTEGNRRKTAAFVSDGYFFPVQGVMVVPDVRPAGWAWLQLRAWDRRLGATYEDIAARGIGGYGESPLFYARGGDPLNQFPTPGPLIGLQSFSFRPANGVLMRSIRTQGTQVVIEWNPGFKRYQLQQTSTLGQPWQNVGEPTTATSVTNSITGGAQFFRVIGLLE
jgi:hypothetical protein